MGARAKVLGAAAAMALTAGTWACRDGVGGPERLEVPLLLSLELAQGPVTWILDSLTVAVDAGGESFRVSLPVTPAETSYTLEFDVPDEALRVEAAVLTVRGERVMEALYDGPPRDAVDLTLAPLGPILAVSAERPAVTSDTPALFLVFNIGAGPMEWTAGAVSGENVCSVENVLRPCLRFSPSSGSLPGDGVDSLLVALVASPVASYGFQVQSTPGVVAMQANVTEGARADLEVRVVDGSGEGVAAEPVEVEGPAFAAVDTDAAGVAVFPGLPLGAYDVILPHTGGSAAVVLLENGVREIVTLTIRPAGVDVVGTVVNDRDADQATRDPGEAPAGVAVRAYRDGSGGCCGAPGRSGTRWWSTSPWRGTRRAPPIRAAAPLGLRERTAPERPGVN